MIGGTDATATLTLPSELASEGEGRGGGTKCHTGRPKP